MTENDFGTKLYRWLRWKEEQNTERQQAIEALKVDVLSKARRDTGYLLPQGFAQETGSLGSTKLHDAIRDLIRRGLIRLDGYDGFFERWVVT